MTVVAHGTWQGPDRLVRMWESPETGAVRAAGRCVSDLDTGQDSGLRRGPVDKR